MKANAYIAKFVKTIDDLDKKGTRVPGLVLSHAGFGKTSTIKLYCEAMDYNLVTLIPSMFSSDDVLGIQSVKDGKLVRLTPSWFNKMKETIQNGKRTILFIDEITTCDPFIQGPLLDLIFNGNLGEEHLPENVFIVAAGNYAEDLNNVFKMSAPLVNRFVILNLTAKDFSIKELVGGGFDRLSSTTSIKKFLGIDKNTGNEYDIESLKEWLVKSDDISFGDSTYSEDSDGGLRGFTSIRSLDNSIKFATMFFENFGDAIWTRVVGDSLGRSAIGEHKPLSLLLEANVSKFKKVAASMLKKIEEVRDLFMRDGATKANIRILDDYVEKFDPDTNSQKDARILSDLLAQYANIPEVSKITRKFNDKI